MKAVANANSMLWWMLGRHRDGEGMKARVRDGYDAAFSEHVTRYDEVALQIHAGIAQEQLSEVDLEGHAVLDVGAGTGIASFVALERGADRVVCCDASERMLREAQQKASALKYGGDRVAVTRADAENLPFEDASFDVVISSLLLGLVPDQQKAIGEMARVLRPGGVVAVAAHGPEYFWEAADAAFRSVNKLYVLGYRFEFWPRDEAEWAAMFQLAGLKIKSSRRVSWRNRFSDGGQVFDYFSAVSSSWWLERFPPARRQVEVDRGRRYFEKKRLTELTDDVVMITAQKPAF
jgi:ubiquinone/menaquinone biosynthesis C-methylase UbiE